MSHGFLDKISSLRYLFIFLVGSQLYFISANAQIIKGRITDINGNPIHNASIFVRELRLGAAANDAGYYELRVPEGDYTCLFQCMGYETVTMEITVGINETVERDIAMRESAYELRELVVSNRTEDPAYAIMRRAIAMAPYYMNQVSEYKAEAYLKGSLQINRISALVRRLARDELEEMNIRQGNTYLEESFNEIEFNAPNRYRQRVIRRTGSMPVSEGNNAMGMITSSMYDPNALEPIISPLSTSAFAHYRFRYEGFVAEDNRIINKIAIIPIRNSKQLLSGYVYIVDNYWNIHSADVSGEFVMGITFRMQVNFGEVSDNIWLPVSYRFNFEGSVLGNRGAFDYVASMKYTNIVENTSIRKPDALALAEQQRREAQQRRGISVAEQTTNTAATSRTAERIDNLLERDNLTNRQAYQLARLMQREAESEKRENPSLDVTATYREDYRVTVDSAANIRDTAFWEMMRPVPLNMEEIRSYQERDIRLAEQRQQNDSTANNRNNRNQSPFMRTTNRIFFGHNFRLGQRGGNIRYHGLTPSQLGFNTVDGFFAGQKLTYSKNFPQQIRLTLEPEAIWAINRKAVMWNVDASLTYAPMKRGTATIRVGQRTKDFNDYRGIHYFENTVSSLFFKRNYLKLYEDNFVEARNTIDITNGLQMNAGVKYSRRIMLDNNSNYSFFYVNSRDYTSNVPTNAEMPLLTPDHNSVVFALSFDYTPRHYYRITGNNQKRYVSSDYPTFSVEWQKGVKSLFDSESNFDYISIGVRQTLVPGLMQSLSYAVNGGIYVNSKKVYFPDFKHFTTIEIPFTIGSIRSRSFNLLEYYRYSTSEHYVSTHLYYITPFMFLKFLPFFSNRMLWQEGVQLNFLYTPEIKNYVEAGYVIGIMNAWETGVFVGFENFKYRSFGAKLSIPLGGTLSRP